LLPLAVVAAFVTLWFGGLGIGLGAALTGVC
jgi:hypothetical protein